MKNIVCVRCGNKDQLQFAYIGNKRYCRRCIEFNKKVEPLSKYIKPKTVVPDLNYHLSAKQVELSSSLLTNTKDTFVSAVTGSGKTEITLALICKHISHGHRVGFIIPRKAIVIEIASRLRKIFPDLNVSEMYQGSKYSHEGDIIVLTAHQSYKYTNKFGLIIVDEYDAFPLKDNQVLKDIVNRTCFGRKVYLSATFEEEDLKDNKVLSLNRRYHNKPLPEPIFKKQNSFNQFLTLIKLVNTADKNNQKIIVYFPTIRMLNLYAFFLNYKSKKILLVHSRVNRVNDLIRSLNRIDNFIVFSTIILERGVTISNVSVYVFEASHDLFNKSSLIQIAGRVGRLKAYPSGDVYFYGKVKTNAIKDAIEQIKEFNK